MSYPIKIWHMMKRTNTRNKIEPSLISSKIFYGGLIKHSIRDLFSSYLQHVRRNVEPMQLVVASIAQQSQKPASSTPDIKNLCFFIDVFQNSEHFI